MIFSRVFGIVSSFAILSKILCLSLRLIQIQLTHTKPRDRGQGAISQYIEAGILVIIISHLFVAEDFLVYFGFISQTLYRLHTRS